MLKVHSKNVLFTEVFNLFLHGEKGSRDPHPKNLLWLTVFKTGSRVITFIYGVLSGCRIEWIRELIPPTLMRHDGWLVRPNRDCPYPVCRQQCLSSGSPEGGHYIIRLKPHLSHGQWEDVLSINGWWMSFCCVKISVSFSIYNGKLKWKIIPACIHTQWSFFELASPAR